MPCNFYEISNMRILPCLELGIFYVLLLLWRLVMGYSYVIFAVVVQSPSHVWLWNAMDWSLPGSSIHRIFQIRLLEWVSTSFFRGSSRPWDQICISCVAGGFFTAEPSGKPILLWYRCHKSSPHIWVCFWILCIVLFVLRECERRGKDSVCRFC